MMGPTTPLDVYFVPFSKTEPVNDAVEHLRAYLIAAEMAAMQQSVVVLPRQQQYGGRIDSLTRVRATTRERSLTSARYGVPVVAYCPTFKRGFNLHNRCPAVGLVWSSGRPSGSTVGPDSWAQPTSSPVRSTPLLSRQLRRPLSTSIGRATTAGPTSVIR